MKILPFVKKIRKKYDDYEDIFVSVLVDHLADMPICKIIES